MAPSFDNCYNLWFNEFLDSPQPDFRYLVSCTHSSMISSHQWTLSPLSFISFSWSVLFTPFFFLPHTLSHMAVKASLQAFFGVFAGRWTLNSCKLAPPQFFVLFLLGTACFLLFILAFFKTYCESNMIYEEVTGPKPVLRYEQIYYLFSLSLLNGFIWHMRLEGCYILITFIFFIFLPSLHTFVSIMFRC